MNTTPLANDREYSILFIGNSYTFYNSMPELFRRIAEACGYRLSVDSVTKGGYKLCRFADPNDEYGAKVEQRLSDNKYDYVFLQEQSLLPCIETKLFSDSVATLAERVRQSGATPLLYQTWGRKAGHPTLAEHDWNTFEMEGILRSAYKSAGAAVGARVSYVGAAFSDVYASHPEIELYDPDMTHPSLSGSILGATVHFSTLFGISPLEIPEGIFGSDIDFATLKEAAAKILAAEI